jgi:hypothetical protein
MITLSLLKGESAKGDILSLPKDDKLNMVAYVHKHLKKASYHLQYAFGDMRLHPLTAHNPCTYQRERNHHE